MLVRELAESPRLVLLCGRYEGFDERIRLGLSPLEVSVGDFVTNGGEVPAMLVIDSVIRLVPGVLGDETSSKYDSFAEAGLLEYPQYTRPREFRGMPVPEVLVEGHHGKIAAWREEASRARSQTVMTQTVKAQTVKMQAMSDEKAACESSAVETRYED